MEGSVRESRVYIGGDEEDKAVARGYHDTVFSGKLRQAVFRATNREGGEYLLLYNQCTNTRQPVAEILRKKHLESGVTPT